LHWGFNKPRLLLVDDDLTLLELRTQVFERNGYSVSTATSAHAALEVFRNQSISLVIADHFLSGQSGVEMAAEMKRLNPSTPIALLSGHDPERLENIDCFIAKSETIETVLAMVADLVKRSTFS